MWPESSGCISLHVSLFTSHRSGWVLRIAVEYYHWRCGSRRWEAGCMWNVSGIVRLICLSSLCWSGNQTSYVCEVTTKAEVCVAKTPLTYSSNHTARPLCGDIYWYDMLLCCSNQIFRASVSTDQWTTRTASRPLPELDSGIIVVPYHVSCVEIIFIFFNSSVTMCVTYYSDTRTQSSAVSSRTIPMEPARTTTTITRTFRRRTRAGTTAGGTTCPRTGKPCWLYCL